MRALKQRHVAPHGGERRLLHLGGKAKAKTSLQGRCGRGSMPRNEQRQPEFHRHDCARLLELCVQGRSLDPKPLLVCERRFRVAMLSQVQVTQRGPAPVLSRGATRRLDKGQDRLIVRAELDVRLAERIESHRCFSIALRQPNRALQIGDGLARLIERYVTEPGMKEIERVVRVRAKNRHSGFEVA